MTEKSSNIVKIEKPQRKLKAGTNFCTAMKNITPSNNEDDAYRLYQSKPGAFKF